MTALLAGFLNKFNLAFIKKVILYDISFRRDGAVTERAREGLEGKKAFRALKASSLRLGRTPIIISDK